MCSEEKLSYSSFPAGHIFRLGVAILVLTGNCVVMRVAATIALLSIGETQVFCRQQELACGVTVFSVLGSVLPILAAVLTGAFAIVAAKRYLKWAFIATFVVGCILMTISFLLNLLFNGLRHGFNIAPVLIPDILEINIIVIISLLSMVTGILCVKSLVKDRSERYAVSANNAAAFDATVVEETSMQGRGRQGNDEVVNSNGPGTSNSLRPPSASSGRRRLERSGSASRTDSRVQQAAEVSIVVENEAGKVTNYDIFTVARTA